MTSELSLLQELRFHIDESNLRVRIDQIRMRIQTYPVIVGGQMLVATLLVGLLWNQVAHNKLLLWLAIILSVHFLEAVEWFVFRSRIDSIDDCSKWRNRFIRATMMAGIVWGAGFIFMFPQDLAYQALVICVALGLAAGATTVNPIFPPSLYIYVPCMILPTTIVTLLQGDSLHLILAGMLMMYFFVALNSGHQLAKTFYSSLYQRYENLSLVEQLTKEKSRAESANREKSRFLATASHDLRQPLQALMLFSDAIQEVAQEKETKHLSAQIGKSVNALVEMFDELLDVSRLEAGIVEVRWQNFELQPLLDRLYVDMAPLAQNKGLGFYMPIVDGVVYSDPFLLDRILRNLISNAIRYTDKGDVAVRCTPVAGGFRFAVIDTGIGIAPEALPHLFEEYYQVDNQHRDRRKGLGLGLSIVRRVEGLLGCKVEVKSEQGKGSEFSLIVQRGETEQLAQPFVITHSRHDLRGVAVALVEDDPDIRQLIAGLMAEWGCRVFEGELAEDVMREMDVAGQRPDLLVCDYRLPQGVTAVHVIKRMRELWGNVPSLVLTGDTAAEVLQEIHASGAILLHKPIAPTRLRTMMHFALHGEG